jgi:hypothetical protein
MHRNTVRIGGGMDLLGAFRVTHLAGVDAGGVDILAEEFTRRIV